MFEKRILLLGCEQRGWCGGQAAACVGHRAGYNACWVLEAIVKASYLMATFLSSAEQGSEFQGQNELTLIL